MTTWSENRYMSNAPTEEPSGPGCPEHLGGHYGYTNVDYKTFDWLVERYHVTSMLDVGCGTGAMIDYAATRNVAAVGIDGDPSMARPTVVIHDFAEPWHIPIRADLIWCVEFVEHVEEKHLPNVLEVFRAGRVLFLTHAVPGQPGWHHVNCQEDGYWIDKLVWDWEADYEAIGRIRCHSGLVPYVKHNGLVFTRRD